MVRRSSLPIPAENHLGPNSQYLCCLISKLISKRSGYFARERPSQAAAIAFETCSEGLYGFSFVLSFVQPASCGCSPGIYPAIAAISCRTRGSEPCREDDIDIRNTQHNVMNSTVPCKCSPEMPCWYVQYHRPNRSDRNIGLMFNVPIASQHFYDGLSGLQFQPEAVYLRPFQPDRLLSKQGRSRSAGNDLLINRQQIEPYRLLAGHGTVLRHSHLRQPD